MTGDLGPIEVTGILGTGFGTVSFFATNIGVVGGTNAPTAIGAGTGAVTFSATNNVSDITTSGAMGAGTATIINADSDASDGGDVATISVGGTARVACSGENMIAIDSGGGINGQITMTGNLGLVQAATTYIGGEGNNVAIFANHIDTISAYAIGAGAGSVLVDAPTVDTVMVCSLGQGGGSVTFDGAVGEFINTCTCAGGTVRSPDLNRDGIVNLADFLLLVEAWMDSTLAVVYSFDLDNDPGWSVEGEWEFGVPIGGGGERNGNTDPCYSGYTGSNVYGVNLEGDYSTAAGGPYYLTAGPFDCRCYANTTLRFARWLNTDFPGYVISTIEVSADGVDWQPVWAHAGTPAITDSDWQVLEYDISGVADEEAQVYVRWGYEVAAGAWAYSGWNIDDVELLGAP